MSWHRLLHPRSFARALVRPYRNLFRSAPGMALLSSSALIGRIPGGMAGVAFVVFLERITGSYGMAGLGAGLFSTAAGVSGIAYGWAVTRWGYPRIFIPGGILCGIGTSILPWATEGASIWYILAWCTACGFLYPPISIAIRSQWNRAYNDEILLMRASTFESVIGEVAFLLGPLCVSAALLIGSDVWAFPMAGIMIALSSIIFGRSAQVTTATHHPDEPTNNDWIRQPRFHALLVACVFWCISFGMMSVGLIAAATKLDQPEASGILLAFASGGAVVTGLVFGARHWNISAAWLAFFALVFDALTVFPLVMATDNLPLLAFLAVLAGAPGSVVFAALNLRIIDGIPPHAELIAYSWLGGATLAGLALGPILGGAAVEWWGIEITFVLSGLVGLVGAVAVLVDINHLISTTGSSRETGEFVAIRVQTGEFPAVQ